MNRFLSFIYSTRLTGVLFIVYAAAMGIATFIENDYGTQTAQKLIYNAWWFEMIMLLFAVNFLGNIFRYQLYKRQKLPILLFHVAFLFILVGAAITRYISYEGIMPIKEGESNNTMFSQHRYLDITAHNSKEQYTYPSERILLSSWGKAKFTYKSKFRDTPFTFNLVDYIPNAIEEFKTDENGEEYIKFVESSNGGRHDHYLKRGESQLIHNILVGYDNPGTNGIDILTVGDTLKIKSAFEGTYFKMATQENGSIVKDSVQDLQFLALHQMAGLSFVIPEPAIKGVYETVSGPKDSGYLDKLVFDITVGDETKQLAVSGAQFNIEPSAMIQVGDLHFRVNYGSKLIELPFHIKLRDFQLENYPGSSSPMSYASEVTVIDPEETFDFRIYMNHILNYKGYKFFQSSYDITPEYEETRLSVNKDYWGTLITYIGYYGLFISLILTLILKGTRFSDLRASLRKIEEKKKALTIALIIGFSTFSFGQHKEFTISDEKIDSVLQQHIVDAKHAESFSRLIIQDAGGRMKPVNTFASELLRKVHKKDSYKGYDANQIFISFQQNKRFWFNVPFVYIKKENTKLRDVLGIPHDQKYAALVDFFDNQGNYKIGEIQEKAFKKKIKSKYEQSVIDVNNRVNLLYSAMFGDLLTLFPIPNDPTNKWVSSNQLQEVKFSGMDSIFVKKIFPVYLQTLEEATVSNDYEQSEEILEGIKSLQKKYGSAVMPSQEKIDLEIFYNKNDIFRSLFVYYMLTGMVIFILIIINLFSNSKAIRVLLNIGKIAVLGLFLYHTAGLGIRWYISGHVPWSNGYESMIYIAWATMLFGLIFGRKSILTMAATAFVTSMILMFAHMNWMDPEIANLVPVLDSYWVMIHVSIIVASYGPFTLCMILGILSMILMVLTTEKNKKKVDLIIKETTIINEMAITLGLVLLIIGNFLGGIWANESWGRYWGWDPKETWALVSIMVYAFILHMRLIPGLRGRYKFNLLAIFAFASILMTYLGVNHLLSGLHSYAQGESAAIPNEIWGWLYFSAILSIAAYFKYKKYYQK